MAQYPLINGIRYEWSSIEFNINGGIQLGIKTCSYKSTLEPGEVRGAGAQILGRTRGELKHEAKIELFKQEMQELIDALGDGFLEASFDIICAYGDTGVPTTTDRIIGCRMKSLDMSWKQGTDALAVPVDLHVMKILYNGKKPIAKLF